MALSSDFLDVAIRLCDRQSRPSPGMLRRAVSSAYYALFHLLVEAAVENWAFEPARPAQARIFDHGPMSKSCEQQANEIKKRKQTQAVSAEQDQLLTVCVTFTRLKAAREEADYDPAIDWEPKVAEQYVSDVIGAFQAWRTVRAEPEAQSFLVTFLRQKR